MPDLSDDEVGRTLDYLGRSQPLSPERLGLATGTGAPAAGGGVTAARTPSVATRAQVAKQLADPGGPTGAQQVLGDISTAKGFAEKLMKLKDLFPAESRRGDTGGTSLSDAVRSGSAGGTASSSTFIDASRDFLGEAAGPSSFGDVDPMLVGELSKFAAPQVPAGFEAAELAQSGASAGAAGAEGASAAGGATAALGPALSVLGGALSLAQDIASDAPDSRKALNAAVDAAAAVASIFFPPAALIAPVAKAELGQAVTSAEQGDVGSTIAHVNPGDLPAAIVLTGHSNDIGGFFESQMNALGFGQADVPHAVREQQDIQKHVGPQAQAFQTQLQHAKSPSDLWSTLVSWGSGTTGGNSSMAVAIDLPVAASDLAGAVKAGAVILPQRFGQDVDAFLAAHPGESLRVGVGNPNAYYPVFSPDGFYAALRNDPKGLRAGVQAGDAGFRLEKMNRALANSILQRAGALLGSPGPAMPTMPQQGVDTGGPKNPVVNPPGPSGALGFAQDVMDPNTGS